MCRIPRGLLVLGLRNYFLTLLLLLLFIKAFSPWRRSIYRICVIEEESLSCLSYFLLLSFSKSTPRKNPLNV